MGDTLNENTLNIIKQDLWATHLFKQIQVFLTPNHVTKVIEVTIHYEPIERVSYDVGVGVMDDALTGKINISFSTNQSLGTSTTSQKSNTTC